MGLVPIQRLSNVTPAACSASHPASGQASLHMLLHESTQTGAQEQALGGFCPCAAQEGRGDADAGDCVRLNPSFHCSKAFA